MHAERRIPTPRAAVPDREKASLGYALVVSLHVNIVRTAKGPGEFPDLEMLFCRWFRLGPTADEIIGALHKGSWC